MTLTGTIDAFDDRRGGGTFRDEVGRTYYFHCVDIADGTRSIRAGTRARARRTVGHRGRDEVVDVALA